MTRGELNYMPTDNRTQVTESTDDHQATSSSDSRRGFLRKAASTGILGMSGLTAVVAASEPARATSWDRGPITMSVGESEWFDNPRWTGEIRIEGVADYSDYTLKAKHPKSRGDDLREAEGGPWGRVESSDDLDWKEDRAFGEIQDRKKGSGHDEYGWTDDYYFEAAVWCKCTSGIIDVYINDTFW